MNTSIVYHARHGDYSQSSYILVWEDDKGICIRAVIDHEKRYDLPNPRFTSSAALGQSLELHEFLRELLPEIEKEGSKLLLWSEDSVSKMVLRITPDGECEISTENRNSSIGVTVRFTRKTQGYKSIKTILRLVFKLNRISPDRDAIKVFEKDNLCIVL